MRPLERLFVQYCSHRLEKRPLPRGLLQDSDLRRVLLLAGPGNSQVATHEQHFDVVQLLGERRYNQFNIAEMGKAQMNRRILKKRSGAIATSSETLCLKKDSDFTNS
jgi:hypothetical protein